MGRRTCCVLALVAARAAGFVAPATSLRAPQGAPRVVGSPRRVGPGALGAVGPEVVEAALASSSPLWESTLSVAYEFQGSYASLYATLFLYVISFPGLWSTIKRASKVALIQQTYEFPGEKERPMREVAGDVMAYMQANNYEVAEAGETITFKGKIAPEVSQAAFLVFCTFICFASLALVLQIQVPTVAGVEVGSYWFLTTLLAPYAGVYYWTAASENEQREIKVKLSSNDDESQTLMVVRGDKKDVERMETEMDLQQEGMIRVRGIFEKVEA